MSKPNTLAEKCTEVSLKQLLTCWSFKLPRIRRIRDYRRLYNVETIPKLRVQFNVPLPVFSGMIDTLQSDLDDSLLLKFESQDPADWKSVEKANAVIKQESTSVRPGAMWDEKWRDARLECMFSGRGTLKFTAGSAKKGYYSNLEVVPFEDFFFEPNGGGHLESHLFCGQQNIWRTKKQLEDGVEEGIYDRNQVKKLVEFEAGKDWKMNGIWDGEFDVGNHFRPLGLTNTGHNYTGETIFHLVEWVMSYEGRKWYLVFEAYSGTWIRFEKLSDVCSDEYFPWISFASHKDLKNFASKSFADDLYPVADSIMTLFNQELTNRQKRNLNARAYDKDMFKDVEKLDEAQYRPDALVPVDTKNGSRKISEGIYAFETPTLTGTVDLVSWLEEDTGRNLGVTEIQQGGGASSGKDNQVGVTYANLQQVGKRIGFASQPFITAGQELGNRFLTSLKDYMDEPMAVKLVGENGFEWDMLRRLDLNFRRTPEITVISESAKNKKNAIDQAAKARALEMVSESPNINARARDEYILRDIGGFSDYETSILLDTNGGANKESAATLAASIQEIGLRGKMPKPNYNADLFFMKGLIEFSRKNRGSLPDKKFKILMQYIDQTMLIVKQNVQANAPMKPTVPAQQSTDGQPVASPINSAPNPAPTMQ